jgi:TolB-like protein
VHTFKVLLGYEGEKADAVPSASSAKSPDSSPPKAAEAKTRVPAIAVLPFTNMGGDPEQEYFADGITEDIITNLSLWRTFPVISRNSSFTFRGQSHNLKQVAKELGARYIVEGSVRKGGTRVRITAQLIDAEEDHHLWSEKWDRTLEDIFDVQDEVSEAIARRAAPSVTDHELKRLSRERPKNLSAWEEYLQGMKFFNDRNYSDLDNHGLTEASTHFEKAIALDDTLSDAYAYLSLCGFWDLVHFTTDDSKATLEMMKIHGRKAVTLNPKNPVALVGLAAHYFFSGDFPNALNNAEKAVQFNPSYALSLWWLGLIQAHAGKYTESEESVLKAIELSPVDPELERIYGALFCSYLGQERYQEALEAADKALQYHPDQGHMLGWRTAALGHLEAGPEAKAALEKYLKLRPNLKTKDDFRKIFVPKSMLADPIIEGLVKAGWEPEA